MYALQQKFVLGFLFPAATWLGLFILHCSAVSSAEKNGIAEKKRFNRKPTKSLDVVVEGS